MKKLFLISLLFCLSAQAFSQIVMLSRFGYAVDTVRRDPADTVHNDSTKYLTTPRISGPEQTIVVEVVATKLSGTVGGVISLLGTIDETYYKALLTPDSATPVNTYTATNVASQTFMFVIPNNPYLRYRVQWAGTGTMSASFTAKILPR